jgi:hypothetical protein
LHLICGNPPTWDLVEGWNYPNIWPACQAAVNKKSALYQNFNKACMRLMENSSFFEKSRGSSSEAKRNLGFKKFLHEFLMSILRS